MSTSTREWRPGMATRCGTCLGGELTYAEDGTARCAACGNLSYPAWMTIEARQEATLRDRTRVEASKSTAQILAAATESASKKLERGWIGVQILTAFEDEGLLRDVALDAYRRARGQVADRAKALRRRSGRELVAGLVLVPLGVILILAAVWLLVATPLPLVIIWYGPLVSGAASLLGAWRDRRQSRLLEDRLRTSGSPPAA